MNEKFYSIEKHFAEDGKQPEIFSLTERELKIQYPIFYPIIHQYDNRFSSLSFVLDTESLMIKSESD